MQSPAFVLGFLLPAPHPGLTFPLKRGGWFSGRTLPAQWLKEAMKCALLSADGTGRQRFGDLIKRQPG